MTDKRKIVRYTEEVAAKICDELAEGKTLRSICEQDGMPSESTIRGWAIDLDHPFAAQYARAREVGYQKMADDLVDIADGKTVKWTDDDADAATDAVNPNVVQRDRLRVDTRKWLLSKALPKIYGEKSTVDLNVKKEAANLSDAELEHIAAGGREGAAKAPNGSAKPN